MASSIFTRIFDKFGNDTNMNLEADSRVSLYDGNTYENYYLTGSLFFPKVSIGLIESQQIYLLQEVSGTNHELRKIPGSCILTGGNPTIFGNFENIPVDSIISIDSVEYTITDNFTTSVLVSPTPASSVTSENAYMYDFVSLNALRSTHNAASEKLVASIDDSQSEFFLYDIKYEDVPLIEKSFDSEYEIENGANDIFDGYGRVKLSTVNTIPTQINIGFSSDKTYDGIYEQPLSISLEKEYNSSIIVPTITQDYVIFTIEGVDHDFFDTTSFYLQSYLNGILHIEYLLSVSYIETIGNDTLLYVDLFDTPAINSGNLNNFYLMWKNVEKLAVINLYGETEDEDVRFKTVLENFGKKLDFDQEYIFKDSDINEELPDYTLLNKKRKELLLEGDNIYPYVGSYKALINIINFFGYQDLKIKEYFLNIDSNSSNFGKYIHTLIPKNEEQRKLIRDTWGLLPSKIYKKTSLFGLFYDLNRQTENVDEYGIPEVEDAFDFSPEEVLIKLYGLKELLKNQFLPLNARIYDITGEGIYFKRVRVDTWSDSLTNSEINLGKTPSFVITPSDYSYIRDLRRIDQFYVNKFIEQGLTGFISNETIDSSITGESYIGPISSLYSSNLVQYDNYISNYYNDSSWSFMPESIADKNFNANAQKMLPLPDDSKACAGAPILLEAFFNITWDECNFSWDEVGIKDTTQTPININHWTWESLGRGESIEMKWIVSKGGMFVYDSGRKPIDTFAVQQSDTSFRYLHAVALPYEGEYDIALYLYDITNTFSVDFKKYEAKSWNVDFVSAFKKESKIKTWEDASNVTWNDVPGPWYNLNVENSAWEDANISWGSLEFLAYTGSSLYEYDLQTSITNIDRTNKTVSLSGDLTGNLNNMITLDVGDYLFFSRNESEPIYSNLKIGINSIGNTIKNLSGTIATVSGTAGSSELYSFVDVSDNLFEGDQILLSYKWYTISSVTTDTIFLSSAIENDEYVYAPLVYPKTGLIEINSALEGAIYSRILCSTSCDFEDQSSFMTYVDLISVDNNISYVKGIENELKDLIIKNHILGINAYLTCGIFSGTYAIEISNISVNGSTTQFRLNDFNKNLYNIDGNFTTRLADYNVDYAEKRIGINSLEFDNIDDTAWEDNDIVSWDGLEYHSGALCGFVINKVAPGGVITVDENESFVFSGNFSIDSSKDGLTVAAEELNNSLNVGVHKYSYSAIPSSEIFIKDSLGNSIDIANNVLIGDTSIVISSVPDGNLKIPAVIEVTINAGIVDTVTIINPGWGYTFVPSIVVSNPNESEGEKATISCTISGLPYEGIIDSVTIQNAGSGYTSVPTVNVEYPTDFKLNDNFVWTGYEWLEIDSVTSNTINLVGEVSYPISAGDFLLLPYEYHKEQFNNEKLQQFYFFIHGKANNPGGEMLSYINFSNGVEGEWLEHPDRTYTLPLKNSLTDKTWKYEGEDYPPLKVQESYSSDILSSESRLPYMNAIESSFTFSDVYISSKQETVKKFTPVIFSYDKSIIPGKKNPLWTITNDITGKIEVMTQEPVMCWNFSKSGNYSVSLQIEDANGNISTCKKNSFICV